MSAPHELSFYRETLVFLGTAGVVIPLMARYRVSPVLGFLVAGLVLGPHGLGRLAETVPLAGYLAITSEESIARLAELGVAFLLFTIGLELSFERLMIMRRLVFGMGLLQVVVTSVAIAAAAAAFGSGPASALVIGACLALSSTAIVLQLLAEQGRLKTRTGRAVFAVLLGQDLAVIPVLFLVTVLGSVAAGGGGLVGALAGTSVLAGLALAILQGVIVVSLIVGLGRLALRPLLRLVARTRNRELFMAATLFILVGTSLLTLATGLSMALGAFVAGLLLSETEFRREIEVEVDAFKGMLLGLFFISVGMRIDMAAAAREPLLLAAAIIGMIAIKALILIALARLFDLNWPTAIETGLILAGGGEFAFLVLGLARGGGLIGAETEQFLLLVASATMLLTPLGAHIGSLAAHRASEARAHARGDHRVEASEDARTLVVGYGRVGKLVGELLEGAGRPYLAIDRDADLVATMRRTQRPVVFGDASRGQFLRRCGLAGAPAVIVTMDDPLAAEHVVAAVRAERTDIPIIARARDAAHAQRLFRLGASDVVPETVEASLDLASLALKTLGDAREAVNAAIDVKREALKAPLRAGRAEG